MMSRVTMLALLVGLAVVAAPVIASAQCIEVTPESWDYGDVKVGAGEPRIVTLSSCADSPVSLLAIEIIDDPVGAFTITSPPHPIELSGEETWDVEVTFAPSSIGPHEATLFIEHDAPGYEEYITLVGVGVRGWRCFAVQAAP
jgi:hypothetical protein